MVKDAKAETDEKAEAKAKRIAQRQARSIQILAKLREQLPSVLAPHPVVAAYVYGSVARGQVLPTSDVDLAVITDPLQLSPYASLELELSIQADIEEADRRATATEDGLPDIDVRIINNAPLTVRGRILQEGILVYDGNHRARVDFEVTTRRRYFDFAPIQRQLRKARMEHIHQEGILNG